MNATNEDSGGIDIDIENARKIIVITAISPLIPVLTYSPANFKRYSEAEIKAGKETIHQIANLAEFGKVLGFRGAVEEKITLDEYIWERYTRDGAPRTRHCLQVQLNAYLYIHSPTYMKLYGDAYKNLIADSNFVCIDDSSASCTYKCL